MARPTRVTVRPSRRQRYLKSTTTGSLQSSAPSTTASHSRAQVHADANAAQIRRQTYLKTQLAATQAAANSLAQESGAPAVQVLPFIPDGHDPLSGWQDDEDGDKMEISHEGGVRRDRACAVFEYIIQPKYVHFTLVYKKKSILIIC